MLNIARNIYAAWDLTKQRYVLPEAEVIPIGQSVNEKRKLNNITKKYSSLFEYENIPLPGFTLLKADRKGYSALDTTWLIIDPRGFLVRITNENLENILHVTGITEGLIQEKCLWSRDNSHTKMTLVPVSSPIYIDAVKNTELIEGKIDMKDVQIGDTVLLQNELKGTYMGAFSLYGPINNNYGSKDEYKPQALLRRQIIEVTPGKYHYQTDLKILKVVDKINIPLTREESVFKINQNILNGTSYFTPGTNMQGRYYSVQGMIRHVSIHAIPHPNITFELINECDARKLFNDSVIDIDIGQLAVTNSNGNYLINISYGGTPISKFEIIEIKSKLELCDKISLNSPRYLTYGYTLINDSKNSVTYSLDKFTKFYKIVKHVKGETFT